MIDWNLVAARAAVYATLLLVAGLPIYELTASRVASTPARLRATLVALSVGGILASAWWAAASVAAMAALPLLGLDRATVTAVLAATPLGAVLAVRVCHHQRGELFVPRRAR